MGVVSDGEEALVPIKSLAVAGPGVFLRLIGFGNEQTDTRILQQMLGMQRQTAEVEVDMTTPFVQQIGDM